MTDQDNLRDRIKRLVDETDDGDSAAQAIIDEFGLAVEEREIDETRWPDEHVNYRIARVVGKWELQ